MAAFLFYCCFSNSLYLSFFKFDYDLSAALLCHHAGGLGWPAGVLVVSPYRWAWRDEVAAAWACRRALAWSRAGVLTWPHASTLAVAGASACWRVINRGVTACRRLWRVAMPAALLCMFCGSRGVSACQRTLAWLRLGVLGVAEAEW